MYNLAFVGSSDAGMARLVTELLARIPVQPRGSAPAAAAGPRSGRRFLTALPGRFWQTSLPGALW